MGREVVTALWGYMGDPMIQGRWGQARLQQAVTTDLSHHILTTGSWAGGEGIPLGSLGPQAQH